MVCRPPLPCGAERNRKNRRRGTSGEREGGRGMAAAIMPADSGSEGRKAVVQKARSRGSRDQEGRPLKLTRAQGEMEGPREGRGMGLPRVRTRRSTRRPRVKGRSDVGREVRREGRAGKRERLPRQRTGRGARPAISFHVLLCVRRCTRSVLGVFAALGSLSVLVFEDDDASHHFFLPLVRQAVG